MLVVAGYQRSTVPAGQEDFDTEYNSLRNVVDLQSKRSISEPGAAFGAPQAPFAEIMLERLTTADAPPEQPQTRPIVPLGDRAHAQTQQTNGDSTCSHAPILPAATCRSRLPNPEYRIEVIAPPPAIQPNRLSDMPQAGDIEVVRLGDLQHDGRNAHKRQQ
jgi:hypothetical protein